MLVVDQIAHQYGHTSALAPITFHVPDGELVCLVGPSGCGKTTLLKIIAGLIAPSQGTATLHGTPTAALAPAYVSQQPLLLPWESVRRNLALPLIFQGGHADQERRVEAMLAQLGLTEFAEVFPSQLSGGMAQRVALGRALINARPLLLMDEPFGALDALTREQMQADLLSLWSAARQTILMVTHSITEAVFLADRVLVLSKRPGTLRADIPVTLPRPRHLEMIHTQEFGSHVNQIRGKLESAQERN